MTEQDQHRSERGLSVEADEHTVPMPIGGASTYGDVALQVGLDRSERSRSQEF